MCPVPPIGALRGAEHFKLVGGMSNHSRERMDSRGRRFRILREESGVDWDLAKFRPTRFKKWWRCFHVTVGRLKRGQADHLFADAGRALGYRSMASPVALRKLPGSIFETAAGLGALSRYDTKGTSLPGPISDDHG